MKYEVSMTLEKVTRLDDSFTTFIDGWRMMAKWWRENLESKIERKFNTEEGTLQCFFETEEDAMAFKLRWEQWQ